jgi:hypothetical protein
MRHENSLMSEILKFVPWGVFDRLVDEHEADRGVRTLTTKSQFVALLHAQFSGASSLREIEATMASQRTRLYHLGAMAPKRSTLADANAQRPAAIFADMFNTILRQAHRSLRKASKDAVRLIDSSRIPLTSLSEGWASYDARCDGVKLHVVYDPDAATPVHFAITPARTNDMVPVKEMTIEPGATYVFDMGYYSFVWWAKIDAAGSRFVTRLKKHTPTRVLEERPLASGGKIIADRVMRLPVRLMHGRNPLHGNMREVHVVIDSGKTLRLVTNDLVSPAEEIAELYKTRWEIELFFRWIKQTLKIRRFLGTSENAVRAQIAVALIAYLLLRMAHASQTCVESLLTFARLVRANLMHLRSIHDLARPPPRKPLEANQMDLALC